MHQGCTPSATGDVIHLIPMPSVSAHVALTLATHLDHVFGVMGNGNAYFLDALVRDTDASFTAVRHEAGAVVAADTFYRTSGRIAAGTATYGAGFTNTLTALAEAVQAHVPLVLVVGDEPTSGRRPWDVDQIALASGVGARTYTVGRADAAATTAIAVEHALTYRVPTVLAIPYDVAALDAGPVPVAPTPQVPAPLIPRGPYAEATVREIADALASAERPLLLAGRGAWAAGAGPALGELADATGALTTTSSLGRSLFPRAEFDLGPAGGWGAEGAMELVRHADVAVVLGASLNQFTMRFGHDPRTAAARIGELLPEDRVVVSDGGHFIGWANMYWPVASPDRMVMVGTAFQAIGLGFPSVLGAALARPGSTVVLTTGDGGGLMALADLESAVRVAGGRGLTVVWNDAAYGAEVHVYGRKGLTQEPMLIPDVDFAGLAEAVGAQGVAVRTMKDLEVLGDWVTRPADERPFLLLDLRVSRSVMAPYQEEIIRANR